MKSRAKWIILSPHLDDGVLSCGGLITGLVPKADVEIWTLFCGAPICGPYSPAGKWLHSISGGVAGRSLTRQRRQEDTKACKVLGAGHRHFHWRDAVYRKARDGRFLYNECKQKSWHVDDEPMISEMATTLRDELSREDQLLVPLGVGRHVDHLIARQAAETSGHTQMAFYAEIPYIQLQANQHPESTVSLQSVRYTVNLDQIKQWIKATECYISQRRMLEEAAGPLPQLIGCYAHSDRLRIYHPEHKPPVNIQELNFQSPDRLIISGNTE
jgi:LmbE family N-acetylglucosaminyl deacetylase